MLHPNTKIYVRLPTENGHSDPKFISLRELDSKCGEFKRDDTPLLVRSWAGSSFVWTPAKAPSIRGQFNRATKLTLEDETEIVCAMHLPFIIFDGPLVSPAIASFSTLFAKRISTPTLGVSVSALDFSTETKNFPAQKGLVVTQIKHAVSSEDGPNYYHVSVPAFQNLVLSNGVIYPHAR